MKEPELRYEVLGSEVRELLHRRAKHGALRHFETHGRAAWWAVRTVGKVSLCLLIVGAIHVLTRGRPWLLALVSLRVSPWLPGSSAP